MHALAHTLGATIDIRTALPAGLGRALVDPSQLEMALLNLAVNGRDTMPGGGKLTIETADADLDGHDDADHPDVAPSRYVTLAVGDTGTGMPPEVAERSFDPFFTTREVGRGTGLGLSMVYGFAKQSGGHVEIDSELDRGTTLTLYLPRAEMDAE